MKKIITLCCCILISFGFFSAMANGSDDCTTIEDGVLTYSAGHYLEGQPLRIGFDEFGYNYGAHLFNGSYANAYLGGLGFPPYNGDDTAYLDENPTAENQWVWQYRAVDLIVKWNDAQLSSKDCDNDGQLDRHFGYDTYIGSGAWFTNHMKIGEDVDIFVSFTKYVAVPADAYLDGGIWYSADGTEIGPNYAGGYAIIQGVGSGFGGPSVSPSGAGLGKFH